MNGSSIAWSATRVSYSGSKLHGRVCDYKAAPDWRILISKLHRKAYKPFYGAC